MIERLLRQQIQSRWDSGKAIRILVSGSYSLDLASEISEPLTGRKWEFLMFPISWKELVDHVGFLDARKQLEQRLLYGMYPEVINPMALFLLGK